MAKFIHHIRCSKCKKLVCEGEEQTIQLMNNVEKVCMICFPGNSREKYYSFDMSTNSGASEYKKFPSKLHGVCSSCRGELTYYES
jgi:hypothetical protein